MLSILRSLSEIVFSTKTKLSKLVVVQLFLPQIQKSSLNTACLSIISPKETEELYTPAKIPTSTFWAVFLKVKNAFVFLTNYVCVSAH
jgi:hypothetical protein